MNNLFLNTTHGVKHAVLTSTSISSVLRSTKLSFHQFHESHYCISSHHIYRKIPDRISTKNITVKSPIYTSHMFKTFSKKRQNLIATDAKHLD